MVGVKKQVGCTSDVATAVSWITTFLSRSLPEFSERGEIWFESMNDSPSSRHQNRINAAIETAVETKAHQSARFNLRQKSPEGRAQILWLIRSGGRLRRSKINNIPR